MNLAQKRAELLTDVVDIMKKPRAHSPTKRHVMDNILLTISFLFLI